jgi:hypothetical protein
LRFDKKTLDILKNFGDIYGSMTFKAGNVIGTKNTIGNIFARAEIPFEIERDFWIYDLKQFISVLSMFEEADITLGEKELYVTKGAFRTKYVYADPYALIPPPKNLRLPSTEVQATITQDHWKSLKNAMAVLGLPFLSVKGEEGQLTVGGIDLENPTSHNFEVHLGETDRNFNILFRAEKLKLIDMPYNLSISFEGISHWKGEGLEYWIAPEAESIIE